MGGHLPGGGHTAGAEGMFRLSKTQLDTPHPETEQEGTCPSNLHNFEWLSW